MVFIVTGAFVNQLITGGPHIVHTFIPFIHQLVGGLEPEFYFAQPDWG